MKTKIIVVVLSAVLLAYGALTVAPAVSLYSRVESGMYADVEALAGPLSRLKETWTTKGEVSSLEKMLDDKNRDIQTALARISRDPHVLATQLGVISANLTLIREMLEHERDKSAAAIADLEGKVNAIQQRTPKPRSSAQLIQAAIRELGTVALAGMWPLVIFMLVLLFALSPRARHLLGTFQSVELGVGGAKFLLSPGEEARADTEALLDKYRRSAKLQYDLLGEKKDIRSQVAEVADEVASYFRGINRPLGKYRCTVHVPDTILANTLYQLLDYLPGGSGRGRIFDIRFGIIGRAWRLQKPEREGSVPQGTTEAEIETLVRQWGMTREEAKQAGGDNQSFLAVPLKHAKESYVGVFYMDAPERDVFETPNLPDTDLYEHITRTCEVKGLVESLAAVKTELSGKSPRIRIYQR